MVSKLVNFFRANPGRGCGHPQFSLALADYGKSDLRKKEDPWAASFD
jgi:hypothetical protein